MWSLLLAEILAITGVQLVPADPALPPRKVTILIEGERILDVGEDLVVPAGARRIDGEGKFLCAAPIDGFAYWNADHDALYASAGVGLLNDHGNEVLPILSARAAPRPGAPSLRIAGPVIDGYPPTTTEASVARDALEAQAQLEPLLEAGIDFVAFQAMLTEAPWRKLLEVAHAGGRQVWGPLPRGVDLATAIAGGQDGFLFLDALLPAGSAWDTVDLAQLAPSIEKLAQARARVVPFLNGNARLLREWKPDASELQWLSPQYTHYWKSELAMRMSLFEDPAKQAEFAQKGAKSLANQRALLASLHAAGVRLVPGSGAPHPWLFPGESLHDELALWQKAGLAPREVLRLATAGAADALGIGAERGSVEKGKYADLVVLDGDPAKDVAALRKPAWVILRGHASSRESLDAALALLRERQMKAQAEAQRPIEVGAPPKVEGELVLAGYTESESLGVRSAAERYTVVRSSDGKLSFCGRRVVPQEGGERVEIESTLRLAGGKLEYFHVVLRTAKHALSVEGFYTAEQMRVERRVDGVHVDVQVAREPIAAVDVGSVTTHLLIAASQNGGAFPVMAFHESLEMEVVRWELGLEPDGSHYLRTPEGPKRVAFDARGALLALVEQRGRGSVETTGSNTLAKERPGLPFSAQKKQLIEKSRALAEEAQREAKKPREEPPPPKSGGK